MRDNNIQGLENIGKAAKELTINRPILSNLIGIVAIEKEQKKDSSNRIKPADHSINFATVLV